MYTQSNLDCVFFAVETGKKLTEKIYVIMSMKMRKRL